MALTSNELSLWAAAEKGDTARLTSLLMKGVSPNVNVRKIEKRERERNIVRESVNQN